MKAKCDKCGSDLVIDRLFIQEIINDLKKNGYSRGGKADTMLIDWSSELKNKSGLRGRTKRVHAELVGKEHYYSNY